MSLQRLSPIFFIILGLVGLGIIGASFFDQLACEGQLVNLPYYYKDADEGQEIREDRIIGQSFVASRPHLERVDLIFHTYNRRNTHQVILRLLEIPPQASNPLEGRQLFETSFNASTIRENTWKSFNFPPLPDSAGKTYLVALASPDSTRGNGISLGGITQNVYLPGSAFFGPVPVPEADVAFRACYAMAPAEKLQVLAEQLTRHRPSLWKHSAFYGLSVAVYVLLLIGFFWLLIVHFSLKKPGD